MRQIVDQIFQSGLETEYGIGWCSIIVGETSLIIIDPGYGWYFMPNFMHKGKQTDYLVKLLGDTDASDGITYGAEYYVTTVGRNDKFGEGYFMVNDTCPDNDVGLLGVSGLAPELLA